jgi:hypothetical protein
MRTYSVFWRRSCFVHQKLSKLFFSRQVLPTNLQSQNCSSFSSGTCEYFASFYLKKNTFKSAKGNFGIVLHHYKTQILVCRGKTQTPTGVVPGSRDTWVEIQKFSANPCQIPANNVPVHVLFSFNHLSSFDLS